jgi:hypothetical protein
MASKAEKCPKKNIPQNAHFRCDHRDSLQGLSPSKCITWRQRKVNEENSPWRAKPVSQERHSTV